VTGRKHRPLNPYIAGSALDGPVGFFGRKDILRLVETELRSLLYMDFMDRARRPGHHTRFNTAKFFALLRIP